MYRYDRKILAMTGEVSVSNKRKLKKNFNDDDYTIEDLVTDATDSFAGLVARTIAEANEKGEHGVMVVVGESVEISDLVPYGKVWQAGSTEAVEKLRRKRDGELGTN
jgi:hypothetical protein